MPNFLLISFYAMVLLWPKSLAIDTEDVKNLADEFSSLTSSTYDIVSKLKFVSQHAVTFVRVAGPVGALIAAGADVVFKPDSEELRAIEKLHEYVKAQFGELSRQVQHQTTEIKYFLVKKEYEKEVTDPLDAIEPFYFGITNPSGKRSGYKEEFINSCKGFSYYSSPRGVLIKMKRDLLLNCRLPSGDETEIYADVLALFQKIEKHLHNMSMSSEEYEFLKHSLLAKSTWVQNELKTILDNANCIGVEQALIKLHSNLRDAEDLCWLKLIAEGNQWQRNPMFHFVELVRMDLMKTTLIASQCVEISYAGDKERIEEEYRRIELLLSEIAAHMVDWLNAKLKITWPIISSECAKTAIGNSPIDESEAEYERVALNIKHILDKMGEERYLHTVIVFPNWTDERQVASICSVHYCFNLTDTNNINVFVIRYEDDQYERAVRASEWFTLRMQIKMLKIIDDWWDFNRSEPLVGLARQIKTVFENSDGYANLLVIRNWMFFSSQTAITLGVTPTKIRHAPTELGFEHRILPPILDAEIFHVHMFI